MEIHCVAYDNKLKKEAEGHIGQKYIELPFLPPHFFLRYLNKSLIIPAKRTFSRLFLLFFTEKCTFVDFQNQQSVNSGPKVLKHHETTEN
jgi:hypothetical protein